MLPIIVVTGLPGSGKTVISNYLAEKNNYIIFNHDIFISELYKSADFIQQLLFHTGCITKKEVKKNLRDNTLREKTLNGLRNAFLHPIIEQINKLANGKTGIIIDFPMFFEVDFISHLEELGILSFLVINVSAKKELREERLLSRGVSLEDIHLFETLHYTDIVKTCLSDITLQNNDQNLSFALSKNSEKLDYINEYCKLAGKLSKMFKRYDFPIIPVINRMKNNGNAYHNINHIYSMLKYLDDNKTDIKHIEVLLAGILFHDIIYKPDGTDNELNSAKLASKILKNVMPPEKIVQVVQLILSTENHDISLVSQDISNEAKVLIDADLSILASKPVIFKNYCLSIREEHEDDPESKYCLNRCLFLESILKKEKIFFLNDKLDSTARMNIRTEIESLKTKINNNDWIY